MFLLVERIEGGAFARPSVHHLRSAYHVQAHSDFSRKRSLHGCGDTRVRITNNLAAIPIVYPANLPIVMVARVIAFRSVL